MKLFWILASLSLTVAVNAAIEEEGTEFEGDIILTDAQRRLIDEGKDLGLEVSMERGASKSRRWPGGVLVYTIDSSLKQHSRAMQGIDRAMKEWSAKTCIRFKERTTEKEYAKFQLGNGGCSSYVGRIGRMQPINLSNGCWRTGIIIHEIGHALGFWHEQSRPDRDDYVTIMWNNIKTGHEHNFKKHPNSEIDSLGVPYDYGSIMHYRATSFSKNGQSTIVAKNGETMGQRVQLSTYDAKQMSLMYKCSGNPPPTSGPEPTRPPIPSTRPPTRPSPTSGGNCKDSWFGCQRFSNLCESNKRFMMTYCKKTCSFC